MDVLHQVGQGGFRVVQHANGRVDDLPHVVGRDVGGHTHGDAAGAVHQQVGEPGGQSLGLLPALIKVGVPVHRVLLDVPEHLVGELGHARLGVTVGGRGIAVDGAEVAVTVHQHIPHGEILGQADQSVVDRTVTVGVIPAQHIAHAGGRFLEGLVAGEIVLIHGVEDTPVDGLQAVPHIGQGPAHDNRHGVFNVGVLHFRHQGRSNDFLVRVADLLGVVLGFLTH